MQKLFLFLVLFSAAYCAAQLSFYAPDFHDGADFKQMAFLVSNPTAKKISVAQSFAVSGKDKAGFASSTAGVVIQYCVKDKCAVLSAFDELEPNAEGKIILRLNQNGFKFEPVDLIPTWRGTSYPAFAWWNASWASRTLVTINSTQKIDAGVSWYFLPVNITLPSGCFNSSHIRVTYGNYSGGFAETELRFWTEQFVSGSYWRAYVRTPVVSGYNNGSYFVYCNSTASYTFDASNENNTFCGWLPYCSAEFFDNGALNGTLFTKWGSPSVSGGTLNFAYASGNYLVRYEQTVPSNFSFDFKAASQARTLGVSYDNGVASAGASKDGLLFGASDSAGYTNKYQMLDGAGNLGVSTVETTTAPYWGAYGEWGGYSYGFKGARVVNNTQAVTFNANYRVRFGVAYEGTSTAAIDYMILRPFVFPEPTATVEGTVTLFALAQNVAPLDNNVSCIGDTLSFSGNCSSAQAIGDAALWVFYSNGSLYSRVANSSGVVNATPFNESIVLPGFPVNLTWFAECSSELLASVNASAWNITVSACEPEPSPSPSPSPTVAPSASPSAGGLTEAEMLALIATSYCPECEHRCRPILWCVPFTDWCFSWFKKCGDGWFDYEAYATG